ncbi:hypothetical protein J6590_042752 [Homalodisca vitripennis]|nr:hypothetical protein J6590_042752 [Homalodisca vitripennis]
MVEARRRSRGNTSRLGVSSGRVVGSELSGKCGVVRCVHCSVHSLLVGECSRHHSCDTPRPYRSGYVARVCASGCELNTWWDDEKSMILALTWVLTGTGVEHDMALLEDCFFCSLSVAASVIGVYTLVSDTGYLDCYRHCQMDTRDLTSPLNNNCDVKTVAIPLMNPPSL